MKDCCSEISKYFVKDDLWDEHYCVDLPCGAQRVIDYCPFCGQNQDEVRRENE